MLAGGRSSEHEISLAGGASVAQGLRDAGHDVVEVTLERDGRWLHEDEELVLRPGRGLFGADVAFPVLHGPFGEDGTVQGLLELLDVPYVGSGVLASAACLDKVVAKDLMAQAGIDQVDYAGVRAGRWAADRAAVLAELEALGLPVFVKPARLGSSVGIAKVTDAHELGAALDAAFEHDPCVIVEAMSTGIEVECSVLGATGDARASQPGEIVLEADWYDFAAKYEPGGMTLRVPARISDAARERCARRPSRPSSASAARASRGRTSSSRASACCSTSSTRCPASRRRASTRSCGRPAACPTTSSSRASASWRSSATPSAYALTALPVLIAAEQQDLGDLRACSASGGSFVIQTR